MKKLLSINLLVLISITCISQNNLQFNQVLTYTGILGSAANGNAYVYDSSGTWVVPTNKVWKIESISNFSNNVIPVLAAGTPEDINANLSFILNDIPIKIRANYKSSWVTNSTTAQPNQYTENYFSPIWLKAGDSIKFKGKFYFKLELSYYISIIEYNLVP